LWLIIVYYIYMTSDGIEHSTFEYDYIQKISITVRVLVLKNLHPSTKE